MTDCIDKNRIALCDALELTPGLTAIIGSGGKTSLMLRCAHELALAGARVTVSTSTHIRIPDGLPLVNDEAALCRALDITSPVCCAGETGERDGKLASPAVPWKTLAELSDYVLVEADGSRRLPMKAHASYEPPIPGGASIVAVLGASGFNMPIAAAAHRPELYARALNVSVGEIITPELAARAFLLRFPGGTVVINQVDNADILSLAERFALSYGEGTVIAVALRDASPVKRIWRNTVCLF